MANTVDATSIKKIGKYEITGILGRGGMGVVYRAEDKRIGRLVAIKTLTEGYTGQPEMLERFYREAQAGILQHPNIVIVYDLGDQDGIPFIVMEHVSGEPLDKIIASGRPMPLIDKLSIIEQVCSALGYAHQRGVIHRDIKPANVIVQPDGHAKIVDFGIARVQGSSGESGLTRTGNVIGTVHYIAPERLKGQPFDGRSDIFATGVMLYYMLAGRLPFEGEDLAVLQKLCNDPHPPLSTYLSNYPPALDAILDRALAKDPEHRYATAEDFAVDLRAVEEELKKSRVTELFSDAERLASEQEFGRAREVLLQLVKIDAQHTGAKQLLGVVQQNLARLQRAEQVRQMMAEGEEALTAGRYPEALAALEQAVRLDPENAEAQTKLAAAQEKKRRYDEITGLVSQAEAAHKRGDATGALKLVEHALELDQQNTKLRALHAEFLRQARLAAQQEQIRGMLGNAKQEISARHFTQAIEILREVSKLDPSLPEIESLLQTAVTGQEQERRRQLLEQLHSQIETCLQAEDYDRATDLVNRAVEQLPTEASLLQLKTRVITRARQHKTKQIIDTTAAQAQETFVRSPHEALQIVERALKELPGEERLIALDASLRQRLKALETEEVRGRYLREAQDAIDNKRYEAAVQTLESYQLEFADEAGVSELLAFARGELARQQRRSRAEACAEQAKSLMTQERYQDAIALLDPACVETGDAALKRMLDEARSQQAESARRLELLTSRVEKLRADGKLGEAIALLEKSPAAAAPGAPLNKRLEELRVEQARKQAATEAIASAAAAAKASIEKKDLRGALEPLQAVLRAYGESEAIKRAIADAEAARTTAADQAVGKSVEAARAALLKSDPAAAMTELRNSAEMVDFAGAQRQTEWRRLKDEAAKPIARKPAGTGAAGESFEIAAAPRSRKGLITGIVIVVVLIIIAVNVFLWLHNRARRSATPAPVAVAVPAAAPPVAVAPTGTLMLKTNVDGAEVFVDGPIKGFTQPDGSLSLPLDPGTHSVRVVKPGYEALPPSTVTIALHQTQTLHLTLTKSKTAAPVVETQAFLSVHSEPGATVLINNRSQGTTDSQGNLILPLKPGRVALVVRHAGYQPFNQSMTLSAGEKPSVTAMLTPIPVAKPAAPKPQPVQILAFSASAAQIQQGQSTTLQWQTSNAGEVSINNGINRVDASGQTTVQPSQTTSYTLTATGNGGTQQRTINVIVEPKPQVQKAAAPAPAPVVNNAALVHEALNRFIAAYNAHSIGGVRAVWTGMSSSQEKGLRNFFKSYRDSSVSEDCPASALNISGNTAQWACNETTSLKAGGREIHSTHAITFSFRKAGSGWTITSRQ